MDAIIDRDVRNLEADAQTIEQRLNCLTRDCSTWARKRAEQDLAGLAEDLKRVEIDVSLTLTDCIARNFRREDDGLQGVFDDFQEIFGCVDTLFNHLKEARLQLADDYVHASTLDHLEVDVKRFEKLLERVEGHAACS